MLDLTSISAAVYSTLCAVLPDLLLVTSGLCVVSCCVVVMADCVYYVSVALFALFALVVCRAGEGLHVRLHRRWVCPHRLDKI